MMETGPGPGNSEMSDRPITAETPAAAKAQLKALGYIE
jgi:hypothetical protein